MTSLISAAQRSFALIKSTPPAKQLRNAVLWNRYKSAERCNLFWGVFDSFGDAQAAAPSTKPLGYDNPEPAKMYRNVLDRVGPHEYAVLYWLQKAIPNGGTVYDFGGHVGVKYYAFKSINGLPATIDWTVFDVHAVVEAGRELAAEKGEKNLHFTESFDDASGVDLFLALGSAQYIETPLHQKLAGLAKRPRRVLVSSTPMVNGPRFVTLQNIGTAFCPYLVEDRAALVAGMSELGYSLRADWTNPGKSCMILDRPEKSVEEYTSLYFELPEQA